MGSTKKFKAAFVLALNNFRKSFYIFPSVWLHMEIEFFGKSFTLTVKLRPLTQKMNAGSVLPSNHLWAHRRRERERERERERDCAPPQMRRRVRAAENIGAVVLDLVLDPKLIDAIVTDLVLVLDLKFIGAADLVVTISSHQ